MTTLKMNREKRVDKTQRKWRPPWDQGWLRQPLAFFALMILGCWMAASVARAQIGGPGTPPGAGAPPTVTPSSIIARDSSGTVTIAFTTSLPIPTDGKIEVDMTGFDLTAPTLKTYVGFLGGLTMTVDSPNLVFTRDGTAPASLPGAGNTISIVVGNVGNPVAGASVPQTITTKTGLGAAIESGPTADALRTYSNPTMTAVSVTPSVKVTGVKNETVVGFTTGGAGAVATTEKIVVYFPDNPNSADRFDISGATVVSTDFAGVTFNAPVKTANTITLTFSAGSIANSTGGTITFAGIKNPTTIGNVGNFTVETRDVVDALIESGNRVFSASPAINITAAGSLSALSVTPGSLVAGANSTVTITFTAANAIPKDGKIIVDFPAGFDISGANGPLVVTGPTLSGTLSSIVNLQKLTITRVGGTANSSVASPITFTIAGIRNPQVSAATGTFGISTADNTSLAFVDTGTAAAVTLTTGALATPAVTPSSLVSLVASDMSISFKTANPIPNGGQISVVFPADFDLTGTLNNAAIVTGLTAGLATPTPFDVSGQTLTFYLDGTGSDSVPGAGNTIALKITGIKNASALGATGNFDIITKNSLGVPIDRDAAVAPVTIVAANTLASVTVTPSSLVAGNVGGTMTVSFTTVNPIPRDGQVVIVFPTGFDLSGTLSAATILSGFNGGISFTKDAPSRTLSFVRTGNGSLSTPGIGNTISLQITGIKNPGVSGTTGTFAVTTRDNTGSAIIDSNLAVVGVAITTGALASVTTVPDVAVAGIINDMTVTFTTANPIPTGGKIVVTFPAEGVAGSVFDISGAVAAATILTPLTLDHTLSAPVVDTVARTLTYTRVAGASVGAGTIKIKIPNVKNPTGVLTPGAINVTTTDGADKSIDTANAVAVPTVAAGALAASPTTKVTPASLAAEVTGNVDITLTPVHAIPRDGKIVVVFPTGFDISAANTPMIVTGGTLDGTLTMNKVDGTRTITFTRAGASKPSTGAIGVRVSGIENPSDNGLTAAFAVSTTDSGNTVVDSNNAVAGVNILMKTVFDAPVLVGAIAGTPQGILENPPGSAPQVQTINLTGISGDTTLGNSLIITATSDKQALVRNQDIKVVYTSPAATGKITFTPIVDTFGGPVKITVTIRSTANNVSASQIVEFNILNVNRAPVYTLSTNRLVVTGGSTTAQTVAGFYKFTSWGAASESVQGYKNAPKITVSASDLTMFGSVSPTTPAAYTGIAGDAVTVVGSAVTVVTLAAGNKGLGYITEPTVTFNGTPVGGKAAKAIANLATDGSVASITVIDGGDYTAGAGIVAPTSISFTGGTTTPAFNATTGTLTYLLNAGKFGQNTITVTVQDNGGTANGGIDTTVKTFVIDVTPVNTAPTLSLPGKMVTLAVNAGAFKSSTFVTAISPGSSDTERSQAVKFNCIVSSNAFFKVLPAIDNLGALTFTVANDAYGFVPVKVYAQDNGGTANGGVDTSITNTFYLNVQPSDTSFITGTKDVTMLEDAATVNLPIKVSDPVHGYVDVRLWNSIANAAFTSDALLDIAITGAGTNKIVTLTPRKNQNGSTIVTLKATDGQRTTYTSFKVTVTPVNDAPVFTVDPSAIPIHLFSSVTGPTFNNMSFLSGIKPAIDIAPNGSTDEKIQTATFTVSSTAPKGFFTTAPAIVNVTSLNSGNAGLQFQVAPGMYGTNTITITMKDSGGTANGGKDTAIATVTLEIQKTFLPPVITMPTLISDPLVPIVLNKNFGKTNLTISLKDMDTTLANVKLTATLNPSGILTADVTGTSSNRVLTLTSISGQFTTTPVSVILTADDQEQKPDNNYATGTDVKSFKVTVKNINVAPVIATIANKTLLEDFTVISVPLTITDESPNDATANDGTGALTVTAVSSKPSLITVVVGTAGDGHGMAGKHLDITKVDNANSALLGSAVIVVSVKDDGRDTTGGVGVSAAQRSATSSFMVTVTAVNDKPVFTLAAIPWLGCAVEHVVSNFVQNVSLGGPDEVNQTWVASVSATSAQTMPSGNPLFLVAPAIDAKGTLKFTPGTPTIADTDQHVTFTVTLKDNGGIANAGIDTSDAVTREITFVATPFSAYGNYNGLFYDTANDPSAISASTYDKAGYIHVNLLPTGEFSGYVLTVGTSNNISGAFDATTHNAGPVKLDNTPLTLSLSFSPGTEEITGTVTENTGAWTGFTINVRAIRSVVGRADYGLALGNYNMVIQGDTTATGTAPGGDGIAWVVVDDTGYVAISGYLGDGTSISQETEISSSTAIAPNEFPLYAEVAGGKGAVYGWVQFDLSGVVAPNYDAMLVTVKPYKVHWQKGSSVSEGGLYASGFLPIRKPVLVSSFEPWLFWNGLDLGSVDNVLGLLSTGLNAGAELTYAIVPSMLTMFDVNTSILTNATLGHDIKLAFDPMNAYLSGSFTYADNPTGQSQVGCYAVYLQAQNEVHGFFLGASESGRVFMGRAFQAIANPIVVSATNLTLTYVGDTTRQFTAVAYYNDGSSMDISKEVVWSSSVPGVASVDSLGKVTALNKGTTDIIASLRGKYSAAVTVTVVRPITSVTIRAASFPDAPAVTAVAGAQTMLFTATANYADGGTADVTTLADWSSSLPAKATIGLHTGLATGAGVGTTDITASFGGSTSTATTLTVQ